MWTAVILVYLSLYLTAWVAGLRNGRTEGDERPAWLAGLSHAADGLGAVGVFLYSLDLRLPPAWLGPWKAGVALLVLGVFVDSLYAHRLMLRLPPHPDVGERGHALAVNFFMLLGMAFHLPMLFMNWRLAFPGLEAR